MRISKRRVSLGVGVAIIFSLFIIGLQFNHLTAQEREIIRAFTEITQTVYEIASWRSFG